MTTLTFSQGIVSHSTTTGLPGGPQNFLVINGDKVDLHAPVDQPLVSVFAQRDAHYLSTIQSGTDVLAWGYGAPTGNNGPFDNVNGGGPGANEYYLYIDIDRATGAITYGHSNYDPISGSTPQLDNMDRPTDQHWFDSNTRRMRVWRATGISPNYGNWTEVVRLFVAKYVYSASFSSKSVNAPSFIGTTVGLTGSFRVGSLIFDVIGNPILRTDSNNVTVFFTTEDVFTSGLPATASPVSGNRARYETFLVSALGVTPAAAYTIVKFDDFNSVLALDAIAQPTSLWGMIEFPIGTSGDLVQVTMSGVVRNANWSWSTVGQQIFVDKDVPGILTTVEDDNYVPLPNQLPVGVAIEATAILLRRPELALTTSAATTSLVHSTLTGLGADDHLQYLLIDGTRAMSSNLNLGSNNVTNVGSVDGRDVSTDGSTLDAHVANTAIHIGSPITLSHTSLQDVGINSHSQLDSHVANTNIHIGSPITLSHTSLQDVGINSHSQLDSHVANTNIHIGSPITLSHTSLQDIGINSHSQLDSHVVNTNIHQPLTVEDVLGSPITSVGNVNTIQFNNSSGFDVVDQTGGVVRIDFNSAFNPIIVQGGSPEQTLTASGEEPLKFIAGSNITLVGDSGATPKTITISASGGGGSPVTILSSISDADGDTYIRTEESTDEDIIRISTGDSNAGFKAQTDVITISSSGLYIDMNTALGSPEYGNGAPIDISAGYSKYGNGGDVTIAAGGALSGSGSFPGVAGSLKFYGGGNPGTGGEIIIDGAYGAGDGGGISITASASGNVDISSAGSNSDISLTHGTSTGSVTVKGGGSSVPGRVSFYDNDSSAFIRLQAPAVATTRIWTLPQDNPATVSGQFLTTNASGILSFAIPATGSPIPAGAAGDEITDVDADTRIRVEASADEDVIRIDTGNTPSGFSAQTNIMTLSSAGLNVNMGIGDTVGAPITIVSGSSGNDTSGGDILIQSGYGDTGGSPGIYQGSGGGITIQSGRGYTGGDINLFGGFSQERGSINLRPSIYSATSESYQGAVNILAFGSETASIRFHGAGANSDYYVAFKANASVSGYITWELPSVDGTLGQVLTTNGSKILSWTTVSGAGGGSSAAGVYVKEEGNDISGSPVGSPLPTYSTLNFIGATITATPGGGNTANVTVIDPGIEGIAVADEGTDIGGSPSVFTRLNFVGGNVTAADAGSGQANITVSLTDTTGIVVEDEGTPVVGSPETLSTRINFVGANVTASDGGSGEAVVTIADQIIPYDLAAPVYSTLGTTVPTRLLHFVAPRSFRILGTTNIHQAYAETGPTGSNATVTIYHDDLTGSPSANIVATVTFTTGGGNQQVVAFSNSSSPNDVDVAAGDIIIIDLTTADSNDVLADIVVTLSGVVI